MTLIVEELRQALIAAGAPDDKAREAARAVLERQKVFDRLATKEDLPLLRSDFYKAMWIQAGVIIGAVVALVKLIP